MSFIKTGDPLPIVKVIQGSEELLEEKEKIKKLEQDQEEKNLDNKKYHQ